ncbi:transposase [Alteromonas sp. ASW11-130]
MTFESWCVYCKPCITKPEVLINYLSRYTHKKNSAWISVSGYC